MFVALDLPEASRSELGRWCEGVFTPRADLRRVPAGHLHVTLVFLGWQDEAAAPSIAEAIFGAAAGLARPRLTAGEVRPVPPRRPRLFALDLFDEEGHAVALQAAVSAALEQSGVYRPERRPWWPHVTLARVKRGVRVVEPLAADPPSLGAIETVELTLYRSTLRPQGALYEPLARAALG
jgi:RNA 2',3'-cyclic 3'-phosphodiesterase